MPITPLTAAPPTVPAVLPPSALRRPPSGRCRTPSRYTGSSSWCITAIPIRLGAARRRGVACDVLASRLLNFAPLRELCDRCKLIRLRLIAITMFVSTAAVALGLLKVLAAAFAPLHRVAPCGAALNIRAIRTMLLAVIVSLKC